MKWYILSFVHCNPYEPHESTDYDYSSKFFIHSASTEDEIVLNIWDILKNNIYEKQLHIVFRDLSALDKYLDIIEEPRDEFEFKAVKLIPSNIEESIEFPHEFDDHETGDMPMTHLIREKVRDLYDRWNMEGAKEIKEEYEALEKQYSQYLELKEKFEKLEQLDTTEESDIVNAEF